MTRKLILAVLLLLTLPTLALAQNSGGTGPVATAWGPRFGFGADPDQFLVGAQLDLGNLAPDLTLTPNAELGFGDNVTTFSISGDLHYHIRVQNSPWRPYVGGGLTFIHSSIDVGPSNDSTTDLGASLLAGAIVPTRSGSRFFTELKLGLGDVHSFKLLAGWNFKL